MKFGLSPPEYELLRRLVVEPLLRVGAQVWVFGSRARGDQKKFSDIDLLFAMPPDRSLPAGLLSQIREAIEESRLPFKVDLVDSKDLAGSYREGILKERVPLLSSRSPNS